MTYILFPNAPTLALAIGSDARFLAMTDMSLGGYFYDHICDSTSTIVGVRYYVSAETVFSQHPVFNQFLQDKRFSFNQDKSFVDIFFHESSVGMLKHGSLHIDCVQEFGGESVVKSADLFGVCLQLEAPYSGLAT